MLHVCLSADEAVSIAPACSRGVDYQRTIARPAERGVLARAVAWFRQPPFERLDDRLLDDIGLTRADMAALTR